MSEWQYNNQERKRAIEMNEQELRELIAGMDDEALRGLIWAVVREDAVAQERLRLAVTAQRRAAQKSAAAKSTAEPAYASYEERAATEEILRRWKETEDSLQLYRGNQSEDSWRAYHEQEVREALYILGDYVKRNEVPWPAREQVAAALVQEILPGESRDLRTELLLAAITLCRSTQERAWLEEQLRGLKPALEEELCAEGSALTAGQVLGIG